MAQIHQSDTHNRTAQFTDGGVEFYDIAFSSAESFAAAANAAITVACQLIGRLGTTQPTIAKPIWFLAYTSLTTDLVLLASATPTGVPTVIKAIATGFILANVDPLTGLATLTITATAGTRKLNILMPDGRILSSPTLTWT